jgi:hypothetical protein
MIVANPRANGMASAGRLKSIAHASAFNSLGVILDTRAYSLREWLNTRNLKPPTPVCGFTIGRTEGVQWYTERIKD